MYIFSLLHLKLFEKRLVQLQISQIAPALWYKMVNGKVYGVVPKGNTNGTELFFGTTHEKLTSC